MALIKNACEGVYIYLWDPERTHDVRPACVVRLFESSSLVRTESTVHGSAWRLQAATTQPLALWDVGHTVALLVYRQVTHVAEQDHIAVLTLSVITDAADSIFIDQGAGVCLRERSELDTFYACFTVKILFFIQFGKFRYLVVALKVGLLL